MINDIEIPKRREPCEESFTFGGSLNDLTPSDGGCPYDRHLGGTTGTLDPESGEPFTTSPPKESGCEARGVFFEGDDLKQ